MKSPKNKRILLSGYLVMRATWPFGLGEVIANVLGPVVNRIVFMVLLLSNFRYFSKSVKPAMNYDEVLTMMQPILLSVLAVLILPGLVETMGFLSRRGSKRRIDARLKRKYCYIVFGSTRINDAWKDVYQGQMLIFEYIVFFIALAPVFLYYSWPIFVNLVVVTNLFVWLAVVTKGTGSGSIFDRIMSATFYVTFMKNAFFCIYLLNCAMIIWMTPGRFPLEFLLVLIVGMRLLIRKAATLASMLRSGQFGLSESSRVQLERFD